VLIPAFFAWMHTGPYMSLFVVVGYILERWINQDLDHKEFTRAEIEIRNIPLVGPYIIGHTTAFAYFIGYFPAMFGFPRGHNSFPSHFPPASAFLLLCWFVWGPFIVLLRVLEPSLEGVWFFRDVFYYYALDGLSIEFWGLYWGLQTACWIHSLADLMDSKRNIGIVRFFSKR